MIQLHLYKEVHTLEFVEISESAVLKHNTEHKKYYILKMPAITLFTLSKPTVNTTHGGPTEHVDRDSRNLFLYPQLQFLSCARCFLTVPVSCNDAQPTGEDFVSK